MTYGLSIILLIVTIIIIILCTSSEDESTRCFAVPLVMVSPFIVCLVISYSPYRNQDSKQHITKHIKPFGAKTHTKSIKKQKKTIINNYNIGHVDNLTVNK